ncbi:PPR18 protein, partial [Picathartes gymnocephalus]|nr:PPR18 protein [Picathartes gymnocephalus]
GSPRRDPPCPPPCPHPALQRRSGNTITVRPRRGTAAGGPGGGSGGAPSGVPAGVTTGGPPDVAEPPPGPPKKRYPTAEQIQVIGGYLALPRSCLAKNDPHRKKV